MRYSGSKTRYIKDIVPIVTKNLKEGQYYVEPFVGGASTFSAVNHPLKIGNDSNKHVIDMWNFFKKGGKPPKFIKKEIYNSIRDDYRNRTMKYPSHLIGYVGNACSYGGAWWNGYANYNPNKNENHIIEAYNGTIKQLNNFKYFSNSLFLNKNYEDLEIPKNSIIFADPPYANTKKYCDKDFNHKKFWDWCRKMKNDGHTIFISEYSAPPDFICVWEKKKKDGMGTTLKGAEQNIKIEKLFTI
jgi:DNA adenine methylase